MYKIYIDEAGTCNLSKVNPGNPLFSLAATLVHQDGMDNIRRKAEQIKFKYWGKTNIVFHANDMRNCIKDFSIFDKKINPQFKFTIDEFYQDFFELLKSANFKIIWIGHNKLSYIEANPPIKNAVNQITNSPSGTVKGYKDMLYSIENSVVEKFSHKILTTYLCYVKKSKKPLRGQVVVESSMPHQDLSIYKAYNKLLTSGHKELGMTSVQVREHLTSISFVTKANQDTETQLADLSAHYLNLEARAHDSLFSQLTERDKMMLTHIKNKIFNYKDPITHQVLSSYTREC